MKTQAHEDPRIAAAIERQAQAWALLQETQDRAARAKQAERPAATALSYVTISRETGAGAGELARLIGDRLGWEVFDRNLLDQVAQRYRESRSMLDLVDETPSNWVFDVLGTWMDRKVVTHERYVAQVGRVILALARRGNAIFVGRGAQFLLPRDKTLAVRVVAPERHRLERIMRLRNLGLDDARQSLRETDEGRRAFIERFFHQDIGDPHLYDLVINTERLGIAGAAEHIVAAINRG